jgi:hypothetical protein
MALAVIDSGNLRWISGNALNSDNMAEIIQRLLRKEAFSFFNEEVMLG